MMAEVGRFYWLFLSIIYTSKKKNTSFQVNKSFQVSEKNSLVTWLDSVFKSRYQCVYELMINGSGWNHPSQWPERSGGPENQHMTVVVQTIKKEGVGWSWYRVLYSRTVQGITRETKQAKEMLIHRKGVFFVCSKKEQVRNQAIKQKHDAMQNGGPEGLSASSWGKQHWSVWGKHHAWSLEILAFWGFSVYYNLKEKRADGISFHVSFEYGFLKWNETKGQGGER